MANKEKEQLEEQIEQDGEEEYRESEDEDFDSDAAADAEKLSSSDDEEYGALVEEGDEGVASKAQKKRKDKSKQRSKEDADDDDDDGIRILTRSQRNAEDAAYVIYTKPIQGTS